MAGLAVDRYYWENKIGGELRYLRDIKGYTVHVESDDRIREGNVIGARWRVTLRRGDEWISVGMQTPLRFWRDKGGKLRLRNLSPRDRSEVIQRIFVVTASSLTFATYIELEGQDWHLYW